MASAIAPVGSPPAFGAMIFQNMRVIDVAAAIIANGGADRFGNILQTLQQLFGAQLLQLRRFLQRGIQVGDVRLVMLVVMQVHGLLYRCRVRGQNSRRAAAELRMPFCVFLQSALMRGETAGIQKRVRKLARPIIIVP